MKEKIRINNQIRAKELRVIGENGSNLGVISFEEAIKKAKEVELDLIEISPKANPPVAKIMDYGKFQYVENKKLKESKKKAHSVETKNIQIKLGTGDHDLNLKAKKITEWLKKGHRVKVDLFLIGRAKYMSQEFLKERLERIMKLIPEEYKVSEEPKKSPKGMTTVIEKLNK